MVTFSDLLQGFQGRDAEVFLSGQFYSGTIVSVSSDSFVLQTSSSTYYNGEPVLRTILMSGVSFVRILSA